MTSDTPTRSARLLWLQRSGFGLVTLGLGLLGLAGYILHNPLLVQIIPGLSVPIVLPSVICLLLSGVALLFDASTNRPGRVSVVLIAILMASAALGLVQRAFDLPSFSALEQWHAWIGDPVAMEGRMGIDTGLAFIAVSLAYLFASGTPSALRARLVRALIWLVITFSVLSLLASLLQLDFLYTWPALSRLALPTSVGLLAFALGVRERCRQQPWYRPQSNRPFSEQLTLDAEFFLVAMATVAGLVAFGILQGRLEGLVSDQLSDQLQDRANFFASTVDQLAGRTAMIATRLGVEEYYARLSRQPSDQAARDGLEAIARSFLPHGFTSVKFLDLTGQPIASIGSMRKKPALEVALNSVDPLTLIWDDGFYLHATKPILRNGIQLGSVTTEQPATILARLSSSTAQWGESGEVGLCALSGNRLACFPTRFRTEPFFAERTLGDKPFPMSRAIEGEIGITKVLDLKRKRVLAAYRPVGTIGLGMVMKIDLAEIYRPIRKGLEIILPTLILLVVAGAWLLRWRIKPIVAQMTATQRAVVESENRFRIACESGLDAFMILEAVRSTDGTLIDFQLSYLNRNAEKLLGKTRSEILHQPLREAVPQLLAGGWMERYRRVVESQRPSDAELRMELREGSASWLLQHVVPLGDGLAVTMTDIGERKRLEENLRQMAQTDPLTLLPNRALFLDRLERAMLRARSDNEMLAVLAIDIDRFQALNWDYGHSSGDAVLKIFAGRLTEAIRVEDTAARIGADQFGIILERLGSRTQAFSSAESLLAALRQGVTLNDHAIHLSASIGIALFSGQSTTATALLDGATAALAKVKERGGNHYFAAEALHSPS